jgi:uncharacterized membrane protein
VAYTLVVALDPWQVLYVRWWTATPGLFAAGASVVAYAVLGALRGAQRLLAAGRLAWLVVTVVILGAALVYPVAVTFDRTDGFRNAQSVHGLAFVQRDDQLEYEAMRWLERNVSGTPVVLEAADPRGDFTEHARVSSRTGLPTLIGWPCHEAQWRGDRCVLGPEMPFIDRLEAVATIYSTTDAREARSLLDRYGVQYVYVGRLEWAKYGEDGLAKFRQFMVPVFENEGVTIYRMPEVTAPADGASR